MNSVPTARIGFDDSDVVLLDDVNFDTYRILGVLVAVLSKMNTNHFSDAFFGLLVPSQEILDVFVLCKWELRIRQYGAIEFQGVHSLRVIFVKRSFNVSLCLHCL